MPQAKITENLQLFLLPCYPSSPADERDYKQWIEELKTSKTQMEELVPEFEDFKQYITKMKENKKTSPAFQVKWCKIQKMESEIALCTKMPHTL